MTAEIVNLQEYRERKLRGDKAARAGKGNEKTGADETEETRPEDLLDNDDENRGGEPA